jgi:hypothetical protein
MTDPFAPQTEQEQVEPAGEDKGISVPVRASVVPGNEGKVVITLKGGAGFDDPWIVIHATDLDDAHSQVTGENAAVLAQVMDQAHRAATHFQKGKAPSGPQPQRQSNAPQAAQQPPAGTPPAPGDGWQYKSGVSKSGKSWSAWMPPQGSNESPVWI